MKLLALALAVSALLASWALGRAERGARTEIAGHRLWAAQWAAIAVSALCCAWLAWMVLIA